MFMLGTDMIQLKTPLFMRISISELRLAEGALGINKFLIHALDFKRHFFFLLVCPLLSEHFWEVLFAGDHFDFVEVVWKDKPVLEELGHF